MYSTVVLIGGGARATGGSGLRDLFLPLAESTLPPLALSLVSMMIRTCSAMESSDKPERVLLLLRRTSRSINLKSSLSVCVSVCVFVSEWVKSVCLKWRV